MGGSETTLGEWATVLVPLIVSLVALGGVVWSSDRTSRSVIRAEEKRHEHAERVAGRQEKVEVLQTLIAAASDLLDEARGDLWAAVALRSGRVAPGYSERGFDDAQADYSLAALQGAVYGSTDVIRAAEDFHGFVLAARKRARVPGSNGALTPEAARAALDDLNAEGFARVAAIVAAVRADLGLRPWDDEGLQRPSGAGGAPPS